MGQCVMLGGQPSSRPLQAPFFIASLFSFDTAHRILHSDCSFAHSFIYRSFFSLSVLPSFVIDLSHNPWLLFVSFSAIFACFEGPGTGIRGGNMIWNAEHLSTGVDGRL